MIQTKQVVEMPLEYFNQMQETNQRILSALENLKVIAPTEYITPNEFMKETQMSRWKFDALRNDGLLNVIQRGRKLYLLRTEVQRYFKGEMELS